MENNGSGGKVSVLRRLPFSTVYEVIHFVSQLTFVVTSDRRESSSLAHHWLICLTPLAVTCCRHRHMQYVYGQGSRGESDFVDELQSSLCCRAFSTPAHTFIVKPDQLSLFHRQLVFHVTSASQREPRQTSYSADNQTHKSQQSNRKCALLATDPHSTHSRLLWRTGINHSQSQQIVFDVTTTHVRSARVRGTNQVQCSNVTGVLMSVLVWCAFIASHHWLAKHVRLAGDDTSRYRLGWLTASSAGPVTHSPTTTHMET